MKTYEFSTKLHNRKNAAGQTVEKVRVWLEESTNNRFLSDAGFKRGAAVQIVIDKGEISIALLPEHAQHFTGRLMNHRNESVDISIGKRAKVAGKADRALFDITRNSDQMPAAFHPKNNSKLIATITTGLITIKAK